MYMRLQESVQAKKRRKNSLFARVKTDVSCCNHICVMSVYMYENKLRNHNNSLFGFHNSKKNCFTIQCSTCTNYVVIISHWLFAIVFSFSFPFSFFSVALCSVHPRCKFDQTTNEQRFDCKYIYAQVNRVCVLTDESQLLAA